MELGLLGAFLGGLLTLLSPCSAMLLPAFFSYAFTSPAQILARTGVFYLGLVTTLVPLGLLAGTLGAFVNQHRSTFVVVAAVLVIVLGLVLVSGVPLPLLSRNGSRASGSSAVSVFALGTVYGLSGVCAGPLLGAVLTVAALSENALYGGVMLLVFAAGMVVPLVVLALLWARWPIIRSLVRPRELRIGRWRNSWTNIIGGLLTAAVGVLVLITDGTTALGGVLGATDQARVEGWVLQNADIVPDIVVVATTALLMAGIALMGRTKNKRRADRPRPLPDRQGW